MKGKGRDGFTFFLGKTKKNNIRRSVLTQEKGWKNTHQRVLSLVVEGRGEVITLLYCFDLVF